MQNKIQRWRREEALVEESVWLEMGIRLFRDLIRKTPDNVDIKIELAKLLVRSGDDEKLIYENLMNARKLFEEVLELFPNHQDALYRLGHIHYETNSYEISIDYFTKALEQSLSLIRMFRANLTISKAFYHLGDDGEAYNYFQLAKKLDKENNFSSEIKEAEELLTQKGIYNRLVTYSDNVVQFISTDDEEKLDNDYESNEGTLSLSGYRPTFSGPRNTVYLARREAEILSYLIGKKTYVSKENLITYIWEEDETLPEPETIKSYISKINNKLKKCLPEGTERAIISKRGQGYKWNSIGIKTTKNP